MHRGLPFKGACASAHACLKVTFSVVSMPAICAACTYYCGFFRGCPVISDSITFRQYVRYSNVLVGCHQAGCDVHLMHVNTTGGVSVGPYASGSLVRKIYEYAR